MNRWSTSVCLVNVLATLIATHYVSAGESSDQLAATLLAQNQRGTMWMQFDERALELLDVQIAPVHDDGYGEAPNEVTLGFRSSPLTEASDLVDVKNVGGTASALFSRGAIIIAHNQRPFVILDPIIRQREDGVWIMSATTNQSTTPVDVMEMTQLREEKSDVPDGARFKADLFALDALAKGVHLPSANGEWLGRIQIDLEADPNAGDGTVPSTGANSAIGNPDVIVGDLYDVDSYGTVGGVAAFAVGTISCNAGDDPLNWISSTNQHPVIGQNMFRLKDGRFEQVGQSWLKHGFAALTGNICGFGCVDPGTSSLLGVGCSDPYSASLNGSQYLLGPRSEVNASTGYYPYPWILDPPTAATIGRRLQVFTSDLESTFTTSTRYFVEGQYVAADDAAAGNNSNNNSYREVSVQFDSGFNRWQLGLLGSTQRKNAAIRAWRAVDPSVQETNVLIPNDGLMILGARAYDLGGGIWEYEYALQNLTSDRSGRSFSVPIEPGTVVSNNGFHDVEYHSGEIYDETDWSFASLGTSVIWSTVDYSVNQNANALRWGTMYNFRFRADAPPQATQVSIGLFKPGSPTSVSVSTIGPTVSIVDCNNNRIDDPQDIANGTSQDCDGNGVPDECQSFSNTPLLAVPYVTGLDSPTYVSAPKGDPDRLFIVEQPGVIRIAESGSLLPTPFLDISSLVLSGGERGLLSMAFHPLYNSNGYFYVDYTNLSGNTVIARYSVSAGDPNIADPNSALVLKTINQDFANHNGGQLQFGPDGMLYVGMGDGGDAYDPNNRAQDTGSLLGKLLRLDVDIASPYIPADNPFVGAGLPLDEIWAIGLRNPWRFSFDALTGDLYIADVGQSQIEEIDFEPAGSTGGVNYGWRCMEGSTCTFLSGCGCNLSGWESPIYEYDHSQGDCSISGGYVYRGCSMPDLSGTYFYADYCTGRIGSFRFENGVVIDDMDRTAELTAGTGSISAISSFGVDGNGELYIVSLSGTVYRIAPNTAVCGNNVIEPGEQCDDGNTTPGDGCDENCQFEAGGDNDSCANPVSVTEGTTPFDTTGATTDGPDEPSVCNFFSYTNVGQDRWYCYTPHCTGTATVSLCGSSYDTKIAAYNGCNCPSGPSAIACNDDSCDTQSEVSFGTTGCDPMMLRIGGYQANAGIGTMTITCTPSAAITDCNSNGIDDAIDILCGGSSDTNGNSIPDDCETIGNYLVGGRLYDNWWQELILPEPTIDHPLWSSRPDQTSNPAVGGETWRCKECHGWDYKGVDGAYGTGSHRTGFPGILGTTLSEGEIFDLLKLAPALKDKAGAQQAPGVLNGHDYGTVLTDDEINDLVSFVLSGPIDDDTYIDPVTKAFLGDPVAGEADFTSGGSPSCIVCHGPDGTNINFGTPTDPEYIGTIATHNPWELMHKVRMGQPGTSMPSWIGNGGAESDIADIGRYAQLSFPVDCVMDAQCDDGVACTVDACAGIGFCQSTADNAMCPDDALFCNGAEICDPGVGCVSAGNPCANPSSCDETQDNCGCTPPFVAAAGSRYLSVTYTGPDPGMPVAIMVTPDCGGGEGKYVGMPAGPDNVASLVPDPANAARLTPTEWGTVQLSGIDIVPDQGYLVQMDCGVAGAPSLTAPTAVVTYAMGDVVGTFENGAWTGPDGIINVQDLTGIVDAFAHRPGAAPIYATDTLSCSPDQTVTALDFVGVVDGFRGITYSMSSLCPMPCP